MHSSGYKYPAMLDLWLIRHGESLGNLDGSDADTVLSPLGERQAWALRQRLVGVEFDHVFTSPLMRARQTAEIALPDAVPIIESCIRELVVQRERYLDTSRLDANALRELLEAPDEEESVVETGLEFKQRVQSWVRESAMGRVIAFTHFGVIREILGHFLGFRSVPQEIHHCAVFRVEAMGSEVKLAASNERDHLHEDEE